MSERGANSRIPVAVLGATGTVGQKFITLLDKHPMFEVAELVASKRSAGKTYEEAVTWHETTGIPKDIAGKTVRSLDEHLDSPLLFSGLDSSVAGDAESRFAAAGHIVVSNSKNHRMDGDVPLVIPEINAHHLNMAKTQKTTGSIITNSNCSTMFLTMALAPIHRAFGVTKVHVTTMQAVSGAGYPGVASMDILGNVVPYIGGEEEKLEQEPQKILGSYEDGRIVPAEIAISAHCNRVPVVNGHLESLSMSLAQKASIDDIIDALETFPVPDAVRKLPSAPARPIVVLRDNDRPQPALDLYVENGMACVVGRIRPCPVSDIRMTILGHNTIRGAAGAAVLNGEYLVETGFLSR